MSDIDRLELEEYYRAICKMCPTDDIRRILNVAKNGTDDECRKLELFSLFTPATNIDVNTMYRLATTSINNGVTKVMEDFCNEEKAKFINMYKVDSAIAASYIYPLTTLEDVESLMFERILNVNYKVHEAYPIIKKIGNAGISKIIYDSIDDTFNSSNIIVLSEGYVPNPNIFIDIEAFRLYLFRARRIQCTYLRSCIRQSIQIADVIPDKFYY